MSDLFEFVWMSTHDLIMRVLIADKFEQSGRDGLQSLGCEISYQPDLKDDALVDAIRKEAPDVLVVRGTKVTEPMLDAGPVKLVVRAGAGLQHDRRGRRFEARYLRFELSRQKLDRRCRARVCVDPRARSSHRRQRRHVASRRVEQERVFESARIVWPHAWLDRRRQDRPGDDSARASVWNAGGCVEPKFDCGASGGAGC